jgi:hypothetical protein
MPEELELSEVIVKLAERIIRLESQVYELMTTEQPKGGQQLLTPKQLDELTSKVEQNLTRKLYLRMHHVETK